MFSIEKFLPQASHNEGDLLKNYSKTQQQVDTCLKMLIFLRLSAIPIKYP